MQYALNVSGQKIEAQKRIEAWCPQCRKPVKPRCGSINVHHWAHLAEQHCDSWWEPETQWHRDWKGLASPNMVEVIKGDHRADIVCYDGMVIELQRSSISPAEIRDREKHYGHMVWIVDGSRFLKNFLLMDRFADLSGFNFQWKHMHKHWLYAQKPLFFDFGLHTPISELLGNWGVEVNDFGSRTVTFKSPRRVMEIQPHLTSPGLLLFRKHSMYEGGRGSVVMVQRHEIVSRFRALNLEALV